MKLHFFFLFLCLSVILPKIIFAQEKKEVEILNADALKFTEIDGKKYTRLIGNVQLKQENVLMWCDSALLDKDSNSVVAWNHIHIQQDTTHAYSQFLDYNGNTKLAILRNNVKLTDTKAAILTQELFYNTREKRAYYVSGGTVLRDSSVIKSRRGIYYSETGDVFFNKNVVITDPNYNLTSDTLKYNVNTDWATFYGNTEIVNDQSRILCDNGWFDTKQDIASFGFNTTILNGAQRLNADSLYYERNAGYGKAMQRFVWADTSMGIEIHGRRGDYFEENSKLIAFDQAFAIYKMQDDSLFLRGDTLLSQEHSATDTTKDFMAFHHAKFFMRNMQGVCDSLFYASSDSTFRMYYSPLVWADSTQMLGDSIHLKLKNKRADFLTLFDESIIISPESKYYNQIQGKTIFGYFIENELDRMNVTANAESLYFGKNDKQKYIGANRATSAEMWMYFKNRKISRVSFIDKPEAVFTPLKMMQPDDYKLSLFNWQIERKPKSRAEITGFETP